MSPLPTLNGSLDASLTSSPASSAALTAARSPSLTDATSLRCAKLGAKSSPSVRRVCVTPKFIRSLGSRASFERGDLGGDTPRDNLNFHGWTTFGHGRWCSPKG
eukprot:scaffold97918_cov63-Phaeocystis_antarctica.AAC.5